MSKKRAIEKVDPAQTPAFLAKEEDFGTEELKQYVSLNRVKVVQKMAADQLLAAFNVGDVVLTPAVALIANREESFHFVPLFFYPEWCTWSPISRRGMEPMILERTVDPNHSIAAKAKNARTREEQHPDDSEVKVRHVEHLNFVIALIDHPIGAAEQMVLSFDRGDYFAGTKFNALVRLRNAPLFGCVFEAHTNLRTNNMGEWYGIDVANPTTHYPWIDEADLDKTRAAFQTLKELHAQARLQVAYDPKDVAPDSESREM